MKTLLLHPRYDDDSQLLWREAVRRGWPIERRDGYHISNSERLTLRRDGVIIYGGHMEGRLD